MTPHKQLFRHDPDNGSIGDCFRTCIACLLDLAPADVPHFAEGMPSGEVMRERARAWLAGRGLYFFEIPFVGTELGRLLEYMASVNPGIHYMLSGKSRNGVGHFVLCRDAQIVHDPSQNDAGIVGPHEHDDYWVGVIALMAAGGDR